MNNLRMAVSAGIVRILDEGVWTDLKGRAKQVGNHVKKNWKAYAAGTGALAAGGIGYKIGHSKGVGEGVKKGMVKGKKLGVDTFIANINKVDSSGYKRA